MKRLLFTAALVVLMAPLASAENVVQLENVQGLVDGKMQIGTHISWDVRSIIDPAIDGGKVAGHTIAHRIYSPDGATWDFVTGYDAVNDVDTLISPKGLYNPAWKSFFFLFAWDTYKSTDGMLADTIAMVAASLGSGAPAGWDDISWTIHMDVANDPNNHGKTICIDTVTAYPPSNTWSWNKLDNSKFPPDARGVMGCYEVFDPNASENTAPVMDNVGDKIIAEGATLAFQVTASDADEDPLTLSILQKPAAASFTDNGNGTADFSWTPGFDDAGSYEIIFNVSDGTESDADTINVDVTNTNRKPTLASIDPQSTVAGSELSFLVTATDPDGTTPTFPVPLIPAGASFSNTGPGEGTFVWTPTEGQVGPHTATFYASDGDLADTVEVAITVTDAPTANVQLIHNVADPLASVVDIWVNGELFLEDFAFRTATPFVEVPAGVALTVGVAAPNIPIIVADVTIPAPGLAAGINYVIMAVGVVDPNDFAANPDALDINFNVVAKDNARTAASGGTGIDFFAIHGATDAPAVDVLARGLITLANDLAYGDQNAYLNVAADTYILDVTPAADNNTVVAAFEADLSALDGASAVVFASGFLNPAANQGGAEFALAAALADGSVVVFPRYYEIQTDPVALSFTAAVGGSDPAPKTLAVSEVVDQEVFFTAAKTQSWLALSANDGTTPTDIDVSIDISSFAAPGEVFDTITITPASGDLVKVPVTLTLTAAPTARLQIIHNSADPALAIVDIWVNGSLFLEDIAYQAATPFLDVPAGVELVVQLTAPNDPGILGTFTITDPGLTQGVSYIAIASGVLNPTSFASNPDGRLIDFFLNIKEDAIEPAAKADVNLLFVHGITDLGTVDIIARGVATLFEDVAYGDIRGYIQVPPGEYTIDVAAFDDPNSVYGSFVLNLAEKATDPVVALASGFAEPSQNQDGPGPTVLGVSSDGTAEVIQQACHEILLSGAVFDFSSIEGTGSTSPTDATLDISLSNPASADVAVAAPAGSTWVKFYDAGGDPTPVSELLASAPASVKVVVDPTGLPEGFYQAECSVSSTDEEVCDPGLKLFTVNLTVNAAPSADTVLVSKDAITVPGGKVAVPVTLSNECPLSSATIGMELNAEWLYIDSVSFVGGVFEGIATNSAVIDNIAGTIDLSSTVTGDLLESGGLWATLHIAVDCDAPLAEYPIDLVIFGGSNPTFERDCGGGIESEQPFFEPGLIWVQDLSNYVCGWVVDPDGNEIPGAAVELWDEFPVNVPWGATTASGIGSFAFEGQMPVPFDLYAYAPGYYPSLETDLNFGDKGIKLVLTPLDSPTETNPQASAVYYCGENTYAGQPLPVGSVVEAWVDGLLVGQTVVSVPGEYGPMFVYRADDVSGDPGARYLDTLDFTVNLMPAKTTGEIEYPAQFEEIQVCLAAGEIATKECTLSEGWNLVSWNVDTEIDDITTVLGPYMDYIDVILGFDQGGLIYDPDLEQFSNLWSVNHLSGYWIRVKEGMGFTMSVTGLSVSVSTAIDMYAGWNLISYLPEDSRAPDVALTSIADILMFVYGWDAGIQIYSPINPQYSTPSFDMTTCNGYWVKVSDDGTLAYSEALPILAANILPNAELTDSRRAAPIAKSLGVEATPQWINVYGARLTVNGEQVAAGSQITAHAEDGTMIGAALAGTGGKFGFMPVYAGNNEQGIAPSEQFYLAVDGKATNDRFTWTGQGDRVEITGLSSSTAPQGELPDEYSLDQNYPNPFNPSTQISFTLGSAGYAKLEIYNVLGKLVATPFEGVASAGQHQVVWDGLGDDGRTASSGVYFYRLTTESGFTASKKMMLLK